MTKEQTNSWEEEFEKEFGEKIASANYYLPEGEADISMYDIKHSISKIISQEREKMIEEFRKKLTNAEMTLVFSSTTGKDTTQKVPMYQPQQIEELVNLLQNK